MEFPSQHILEQDDKRESSHTHPLNIFISTCMTTCIGPRRQRERDIAINDFQLVNMLKDAYKLRKDTHNRAIGSGASGVKLRLNVRIGIR